MSDENLGITSVLPVAEGCDDAFELKLPPANGLDYLRMVRLEAKACPATVTVEIKELPSLSQKCCLDDHQPHRASALSNKHIPKFSPAPEGYSPSLLWQRSQVAAFSKIRLRLTDEMKAVKKKLKCCPRPLPVSSDIYGWYRLCFGNVNQHIVSKIVEAQGLTLETACHGDISVDDSGEGSSCTLPLVSILAFIDQETLLLILGYHISWFEAVGFTQLQGQWFYSLLAILQKPLLPESCSLLRQLARLCSNLRASLDSAEDQLLPQLNLMICIISRYFEQADMVDES